MTSLGKIYPYYVIEVVACSMVRFSWSDKLLTALDVKLQCLKFTILFIIADMCRVKGQEPEDAKNLATEYSFTLG